MTHGTLGAAPARFLVTIRRLKWGDLASGAKLALGDWQVFLLSKRAVAGNAGGTIERG